AGGKTIVDATAVDYGRDVEAVKRIADQTGIKIVATAGFNKSFLWSAQLPEHVKNVVGNYHTYYEWIDNASINELTSFVIREIEEGLEGTNILGGQVKFGTDYNRITPLEEKALRAFARAHHETKAPIHSHTEAGTMALEQIELLKSENINMEYMSFGHIDRNIEHYNHAERDRTKGILELVSKGYEDQILVSGDTARKSYYKHYDYGLGLENIISKWVPRFIDEANLKGYDGEMLIKKFFIDNPARCFTFKK